MTIPRIPYRHGDGTLHRRSLAHLDARRGSLPAGRRLQTRPTCSRDRSRREELLALAGRRASGRVNLIQMSYYEFDNRYMLDMIKLYPERFVGTAIVDPLATTRAARCASLRRAECTPFAFSRYGKQPPARWLEPAGYAAMFATAAQTGQALSCLIDPDGFPEVDRMCRRFPRTAVIIDHLGRIGAGPDGAIRDADVDALCALAKHQKVYVKVGAFYALGKKTPPYLDLAPLDQASRPGVRRTPVHVGKRLPVSGGQAPLRRQRRLDPRPSRLSDPRRSRVAAVPHRRASLVRSGGR